MQIVSAPCFHEQVECQIQKTAQRCFSVGCRGAMRAVTLKGKKTNNSFHFVGVLFMLFLSCFCPFLSGDSWECTERMSASLKAVIQKSDTKTCQQLLKCRQ